MASLAAVALAAGCLFKSQPFKGVVSYNAGKVYLKPGRYYSETPPYYRVGELSLEWERLSTKARTISWYNQSYRSSISTDAYCGRSVQGRSLASLGGDLITALDNRKFAQEREFTLAGRSALRQAVQGTVDGVPTQVDLVVVRKDGCVFDFYLVSQGAPEAEALEDFEAFFGGFDY
ncbi:MAG: hypothetical protein PHW33_04085 [Candidatus Portnoybacteria bacterium]|nr:hypothetical protein [Candidatus Portnoybacteria bacterium]